jgi:hypothetical protein
MADPTVAAETCVALGATDHQFESFPGRDIALGALTVTRVTREQRSIQPNPRHACALPIGRLRRIRRIDVTSVCRSNSRDLH